MKWFGETTYIITFLMFWRKGLGIPDTLEAAFFQNSLTATSSAMIYVTIFGLQYIYLHGFVKTESTKLSLAPKLFLHSKVDHLVPYDD